MRKANQGLKDSSESAETSQSRANTAQREKRGRSDTDLLQASQLSKKKSRQNLRDDESRSRASSESRSCIYCREKFSQKTTFHKEDNCWKKYSKKKPQKAKVSEDPVNNEKKTDQLYSTAFHSRVYHATVSDTSNSEA